MTFTQIARDAAVYIGMHGWTQNKEVSRSGAVCLTGAVRRCTPQRGDAEILVAVLRHQGRGEGWNDTGGRTQAEVTAYLASVEVTDADLAETFGPQWEAIVGLVRRVADLTADEQVRLAAAWNASRNADLYAAWDAARDAARNVSWDAAWDAARNAEGEPGSPAAWHARVAAGTAALALEVRDRIGQNGYTADHYRTLTRPWASVIGPVHPDDEKDGLL